jgi:hypothetical protein
MVKKKDEITVSMEDLIELNIQIVSVNGKHGIQFRKTLSIYDKNIKTIQSIMTKALDDDVDLIMPVRLKIYNKPLAIGKLRQIGLLPMN